MSGDVIQFHLLRSTSRTNADVFNALKALPLWSAFLPDTLQEFSNGWKGKGYQLWFRRDDVFDQPDPELPQTLLGVMFTVLIDRIDPEAMPIQGRREQLLDVFRALPDANTAVIPEHLGMPEHAKQLDGTNHMMVTKLPTPPHVYLGLESPALA